MTLCSVMIPSRKRIKKLIHSLNTVAMSATGQDYEVLIRLDEDDAESIGSISYLQEQFRAQVEVGPRLGYNALDTGYYCQLEQRAGGTWAWIAGDDMEVDGDWMGELRKVPESGFIVQPEFSKLGASTYHRAEAQAFPIFPRFCWKQFSKGFPAPFDTAGSDLLKRNRWRTAFLQGVTFWHDRASEDEIAAHRQ